MDEATAACDGETDRLVTECMRTAFRGTTQFVIAHRLKTIVDSDYILLLDAGRVKEFGNPRQLYNNTNGEFKQLIDTSGDAAMLQELLLIES